MIVRKIKAEELARTIELFSLAFEFPTGKPGAAGEQAERMLKTPESREDLNALERWAAFEDDNKTMMAFFIASPFPVNFDGNCCEMRGIGAVSSLPQYRRHGAIRACFEKAFQDLYEGGCEFSYLYPFSTGYYRQFGYEMCCEKYQYTIDFRSLRKFPVRGSCSLIEPGNLQPITDIRAIHKAYTERYNLTVRREDCDWQGLFHADPCRNGQYTYVFRNEAGVPKGYFTFTKQREENKTVMQCGEFLFVDLEGLQGLLKFAGTFSSYYQCIRFSLPTDLDITPLVPEMTLYPFSCERVLSGMGRVIHAQKVLTLARYRGSGSAVIKIEDSQIKQNSRAFEVIFAEGKAVSVEETGKQPDIVLPITEFSRMILGAKGLGEGMGSGVQVFSNEETLERIFYRKRNTVIDYF